MREEIVTCVLFAWKNGAGEIKSKLGPNFIREVVRPEDVVHPQTENELALVYAFLSLADSLQYDLSKMTPLGCFYNRRRLDEDNARKTLLAEELAERAEMLCLESFTAEEGPAKKRRVEAALALAEKYAINDAITSSEMQARNAVVETEGKERSDIKKQKLLGYRLFDSTKSADTEARPAKKSRLETLEYTEIQARNAIIAAEEKAKKEIEKQMRLAYRLFDPKVETIGQDAKKARIESVIP